METNLSSGEYTAVAIQEGIATAAFGQILRGVRCGFFIRLVNDAKDNQCSVAFKEEQWKKLKRILK
jgi:hypothetical protein